MSEVELGEIVEARIERGERIEAIQKDLKENGVDIDLIYNKKQKKIEQSYQELTNLKNLGLEEKLIQEEITKKFELDEKEYQQLSKNLIQKGWLNIVLGSILLLFFGSFFLMALGIQKRFRFGAIVIIFSITLIIRGIKQIKKTEGKQEIKSDWLQKFIKETFNSDATNIEAPSYLYTKENRTLDAKMQYLKIVAVCIFIAIVLYLFLK